MSIHIEEVRSQFPILDQEINGKPLVYLDNGASSQKPSRVIESLKHYYENDHANVHRGVHTLSQRATDAFEAVRKQVQQLINAQHEHEIIYTRGTTEAINLVASSFGKVFIEEVPAPSLMSYFMSPDITRIPKVKDSDTIVDFCEKYYNDKNFYLKVAEHNNLPSFRKLKTGSNLEFPPIKK